MTYKCSRCGRGMGTAYSIGEWKKGWLCTDCVEKLDMNKNKQVKKPTRIPLNKGSKDNKNTTIKGDRKYNN